MSFELKTAPSLFQKAMKRIFSLILSIAFVYIDDIFLFSPNIDSYASLLSKFYF